MHLRRFTSSLIVPCLAAGWLLTQEDAGRADPSPPSSHYTMNELLVLDDIWGFGDPGKLEASKDIVAPDSPLGFSLKVDFPDDPGAPVNWWSIRSNLPGATAPYNTLSFDIYPVTAVGQAGVTVSLAEPDDNRWVALDTLFSSLKMNQWNHVSITRDNMRHWEIAQGRPFNWDNLARITIEPHAGHSVFYIDGVKLSGPDGKTMDVFSTADDGLYCDPSWKLPLQPALPEGAVVFPFDYGALERDPTETPVQLRSTLGMPVCIPNNIIYADMPTVSATFRKESISLPFYGQMMHGYAKYITRRQAWDKGPDDLTMNNTAATDRPDWDFEHSFSMGDPASFAAERNRIDTLIKTGFTTMFVVDYVYPYHDFEHFGYSDSEETAFRKDLAGTDEGIHLSDNGKSRLIHFSDYFRSYNGFYPTLATLGLTSWSDFTPPKPSSTEGYDKARFAVYMHLLSYEWLKFADRVGRYYKSKGGQGLWIIPNGESTYVSTDYYYISQCSGVGNLLPEWFGNVGQQAEAGYSSLPYLREAADRAGNRLSVNVETGAGGHAQPYWDWRVAYNGVYEITSEGCHDNMENDFIDEAPFKVMSDPANIDQFHRFRDAITKARAFQEARDEKPQIPSTPIVCITNRPVGMETSSIFFGLSQEYSLAPALEQAHLPFRTRDLLDLENGIAPFNVTFYAPIAPKVGDILILKHWLSAAPGRILVTHTFVPTRDAAGWWNKEHDDRLGSAPGGSDLGLGHISLTNATHCTITSAVGPWESLFPVGKTIDLPEVLTRCSAGKPLVMTDAGPLATLAHCGKGDVVYLNFSSKDPSNPAVAELNRLAALAVARMANVAPICEADPATSVQVFNVAGGHSIVAWDTVTRDRWNFVYQPGIPPLLYDAPGVSHDISIPASGANPWLVYSFWSDQLDDIKPQDGKVTLHLSNALTGLYYAGLDTPAFHAMIEHARANRQKLINLKFASVP